MLRICALFVLLVMAAPLGAQPSGSIHVIDGDSLRVGGITVRLHGIDAPETDQMCGAQNAPAWRCGDWVRQEVRARYQGKTAKCETVDTDAYGRAVAKCSVAGRDIGADLVSDGLAFAFRRYSMDYDLLEKGAAVNARGLHATGVQSPAAFRKAGREIANMVALEQAPPGCVIKGNISADGKHIYHMPGQVLYSRTRINTAKGERWFCTKVEAQAAGWRGARR